MESAPIHNRAGDDVDVGDASVIDGGNGNLSVINVSWAVFLLVW